MLKEVKVHREEVRKLCKKHFVEELYLFGSAVREDFDAEKSDLDLAVKFSSRLNPLDYAENYFSFLSALEQMFNRKIDLLSLKALKNPVIRKEIEQSKVMLYAA